MLIILERFKNQSGNLFVQSTPGYLPSTHFPRYIIHNNIHDPPGRPIISGCQSISENLSKLIDPHLKPHVANLPSYMKYTIHLLQILEDLSLPPGAWLVAIDVEALYSELIQTKRGT